MRIAIVEDQKDDILQLQNFLKRYFADEVHISSFNGGIEFLKTFERYPHYDIIFLDIHMPGMNGMEVAESIRKSDESTYIIFVTYTQEYALAGYSVNAYRYLVKPVAYDDFSVILDRITRSKNRAEHLFIFESNNVNHRIPSDTIIYIEKVDKKTEFHLCNGNVISSKWLIRDILMRVKEISYLISPYQSFIVNMKEIRSVHKAAQNIEMSDVTIIPISRGHLIEFMDSFLNFIGVER